MYRFCPTYHKIAAQLPEGAQHPAEGDELQLSVVHNRRTGARRASAVTLIARAADRRQLGQVRDDASLTCAA
jgi:hypothetical protein